MKTLHGFLVLQRQNRASSSESGEVLVRARAVTVIEPHKSGCYILVGDKRFDVAHSHIELAQAVAEAWGGY